MIREAEQDFMLYAALLRGEQGEEALRCLLEVPALAEGILSDTAALSVLYGGKDGRLRQVLSESPREEEALLSWLRSAGLAVKGTLKDTLEDPALVEALAARPRCLEAVLSTRTYRELNRGVKFSAKSYPNFSRCPHWQDGNSVYFYLWTTVYRTSLDNLLGLEPVGELPAPVTGAALYADSENIYLYGGNSSGGYRNILRASRTDPARFLRANKSLPADCCYSALYADASYLYLYGGQNTATGIQRASVSAPDTFEKLEAVLPQSFTGGPILETDAEIYLLSGSTILKAVKTNPAAFEKAAGTFPVNLDSAGSFTTGGYSYLFGVGPQLRDIYRALQDSPAALTKCGEIPKECRYAACLESGGRLWMLGSGGALSADIAHPDQMENEIGALPEDVANGTAIEADGWIYLYPKKGNWYYRAPVDRPWRMNRAGSMPGYEYNSAPEPMLQLLRINEGWMLLGRKESSNGSLVPYLFRSGAPQTSVKVGNKSGLNHYCVFYDAGDKLYSYESSTVHVMSKDPVNELFSVNGTAYLPRTVPWNTPIYWDERYIYLYGVATSKAASNPPQVGILRARVEDPTVFVELEELLPLPVVNGTRLLSSPGGIYLLGQSVVPLSGGTKHTVLYADRSDPAHFTVLEEPAPINFALAGVYYDSKRAVFYKGTMVYLADLI